MPAMTASRATEDNCGSRSASGVAMSARTVPLPDAWTSWMDLFDEAASRSLGSAAATYAP